MSLKNDLHAIYTSGDSVTVLQLLNNLINRVEKYNNASYFAHLITFNTNHPTGIQMTIAFVSAKPDAIEEIDDIGEAFPFTIPYLIVVGDSVNTYYPQRFDNGSGYGYGFRMIGTDGDGKTRYVATDIALDTVYPL